MQHTKLQRFNAAWRATSRGHRAVELELREPTFEGAAYVWEEQQEEKRKVIVVVIIEIPLVLLNFLLHHHT